jgi:hypothetical protein
VVVGVWRLDPPCSKKVDSCLPSTSHMRARSHGVADLVDYVAMVIAQGRDKADLEDPSRIQRRWDVR